MSETTPSVSKLRGLFESSSKRKPQTPYEFQQQLSSAVPPPPASMLVPKLSFSSYSPSASSPPLSISSPPSSAFRAFSAKVEPPPSKQHKKQTAQTLGLKRATTHLLPTYQTLNHNQFPTPSTQRDSNTRVLTRDLSKPFSNDGFDNKNSDLILTQGDMLTSSQFQFKVLELLGQGTFGQVVKCQASWHDKPRMVAVKVVKNKPAYHNQAKVEIKVLQRIQQAGQAEENIINLLHEFEYHSHLCLVFELLSINLYEYIKSQEFRGLPFNLVRKFTWQLLDALDALNQLKIIHCDLKPENILLENFHFDKIKLIDLGSSCYQDSVAFAYIQSRFYRAPEILFGPAKKYTAQIDLWSLGCVVIELFQGLPVFPGCSQHNQVLRMVEMCGMPPAWMLAGTQEFETDPRKQFFVKQHGSREWKLKTSEDFAMDCGLAEVDRTKRYVKERTLDGVILRCEDKRRPKTERVVDLDTKDLECLVDFCQGVLQMDPNVRWTALQAKQHPLVSHRKFTGPFVPDLEEEEEEVTSQMEDEDDYQEFDVEEEEDKGGGSRLRYEDRKRTKPMAIVKEVPNSRPLARRKLSEVGSPFLSSVHQSPIFRPDGVRPLSESWASPRVLGNKFMSLPGMILSGGVQSPSSSAAAAAATQSSPHATRSVNFRANATQPSPTGSWKQVSMLSSSLQEQPILVGDPQPPAAPITTNNHCVEKTLASWAPFDKDSQEQ
ncbi:hypothetical protein BASA81_005539 [Batrachochytrium salamandrivorans]|nr:hypothetical protein BASA81_005539 [Batrachochytrium salamandrivorans]